MNKKIQRTFIELIILFILTFLVIAIIEYRASFMQKNPLVEPTVVIIEKGMGLNGITELLYDEGVIQNKRRFIALAKIKNIATRLKAGRYIFYPDEKITEIMEKIEKGESYEESLTFPEGITRFQMGKIVGANTEMDSSKFVEWSENENLLEKYDISSGSLEGYLFPETYKIYWGMDEEELVSTMARNFWSVFDDSLVARCDVLGMSVHEVVTLASIIEDEAQVNDERTIISAVFHNRLERGQKLESCATVLYALGKHKDKLLLKDLKVDSPYNTYIYVGLPPGPICNPGKASIYAALFPADVDYYYFVSKGDGTHIFSKTSRGHINAKNAQKRKK